MNRMCLMGTQFIIMTDHFALLALYNNMGRTAPHRVERHRGKLRSFDMLVKYIPADKNPCHYGSRHPNLILENLTREQREEIGLETKEEVQEIRVLHMLLTVLPAIMMEQLRDTTEKDQ